ncbi:wall-associated receptor kinase 3-like [Triticum dicoccoides]|uniref:wall-associated receptor kinase 3-like n=1 Tax=Triticum dicoccoides TaxID=85692 RepID=UPI00189144B5|nr:wall-associated receptor kinase 3-like [Triticum dicoccoides]
MFSGRLRHDVPYMFPRFGQSELIVTGCNVHATVKRGNITVASCTTLCDSLVPAAPIADDGTVRCSGGTGCCHGDVVFSDDENEVNGSSIPGYDVQLTWLGHGNRSADLERFPMRVFIADIQWFANSSISNDLLQPSVPPSTDTMAVPLFLYWEIVGDDIRHCKSNHSERIDARKGYTSCTCKQGFRGNPYLADGCKAVSDCDGIHGCYGECINKDGISTCRCPPGTIGNYAIPGGCLAIVADTNTAASCMTSCGGVTVSYPFGMGPSTSCYLPGFDLTCDRSHHPPQLLLGNTDFQVVNISLDNSTIRVTRTYPLISAGSDIGSIPYHFGGDLLGGSQFFFAGEAPYSLSTRNELVVTGCNAQATLLGHRNPAIISGCASFCYDNDTGSSNGLGGGKYCHGMGCCQAPISESLDGMPKELIFKWFDNTKLKDILPLPGYTFIAEQGWFEQQGHLIMKMGLEEMYETPVKVPILLGWEVLHNGSSTNAKSRRDCPGEVARDLCKSEHSQCKLGNRGHTCKCNDGYHGNPYITDGCKGTSLDWMHAINFIFIGVASGAGLILLVLIIYFISYKYKQRRSEMLKQKFFEQNRGQLLQQLVSQRADIAEKMIITLEELEKATNNFDKARELGGGGHGTVYKGILSDLHVVAIKKPKILVQKEIDEFINEVAILSQINHRNVVKLYGCCLETEVPMLVYEFISNGTLYEHLHVEGPTSLTWEKRLQIAIETAKSLAYLHSTALIPIIHRDIKSANILLDDTLTAKVADFGSSRYIPLDKSGLTTMVQGTLGYLDPMYFYTGRLTEKSDVYSFGVMLIELMTRKKPFSYTDSQGDGLVAHFATLFVEGSLFQILDPQVMNEGGNKIEDIAEIAVACIELRGEVRPTMRQVELRLEGVLSHVEHVEALMEEFDVNGTMIKSPVTRDGISDQEGLSSQYSMEEDCTLSKSYPR